MNAHGVTRLPVQLPPIIFGATALGNLFCTPSDHAKHNIVKEWMREVATPVVIDAAGKYGAGLALEVIGRELLKLGVAESDVIISNKLAWRRAPLIGSEPTFEPGVWHDLKFDAVQDVSYEGILHCWREGNSLLSPYRAQLVSVHDPDEYLARATDERDRHQRLGHIKAAYEALMELRERNEVLGVGIGAKNWRIIVELSESCEFDWVMFANSFTIMEHPLELSLFIQDLHSKGVTVINSALFHGGFLLGRDFLDYASVDLQNSRHQKAMLWRTAFNEFCHEHQLSSFELGLAFGKSHPGISSVALSSSKPGRISSQLAAFDKRFPPNIWSELKQRGLVESHYAYL